MRDITCPSGLRVRLRDHTPAVIRLVQPNTLLQQYQQAVESEDYRDQELWFRRLEKILKVIISDPPIFIAEDIEDPVPPNHLPTYEISDEDLGYILGEWMAPIAQKLERLEEDALPFSPTPTPASPSTSCHENTEPGPPSSTE